MAKVSRIDEARAEARAQQWTRRFEALEDMVARHVVEGRWIDANRARQVLRRAYDHWNREQARSWTFPDHIDSRGRGHWRRPASDEQLPAVVSPCNY